jgi:hypothetical protein
MDVRNLQPRVDRRRTNPIFAAESTPRRAAPTNLNVAPLNHAAGAVVTLMERSNVSTVLCAGQTKKWRGAIVGYDIPTLRAEVTASRDYVFAAAGIA